MSLAIYHILNYLHTVIKCSPFRTQSQFQHCIHFYSLGKDFMRYLKFLFSFWLWSALELFCHVIIESSYLAMFLYGMLTECVGKNLILLTLKIKTNHSCTYRIQLSALLGGKASFAIWLGCDAFNFHLVSWEHMLFIYIVVIYIWERWFSLEQRKTFYTFLASKRAGWNSTRLMLIWCPVPKMNFIK
jgi:hypothetical protein